MSRCERERISMKSPYFAMVPLLIFTGSLTPPVSGGQGCKILRCRSRTTTLTPV